MGILQLRDAIEKDKQSSGLVFINETPQVRSGRKNDYMLGQFLQDGQSVEFKIWEERTYQPVLDHGRGIYEADVTGSDYYGVYLTVRRIRRYEGQDVTPADFMKHVPPDQLKATQEAALAAVRANGCSDQAVALMDKLTNAPELGGRFWTEGAAVRYHDNQVRGLAFHTFKMLRIMGAVLADQPYLQSHADLLSLGIVIHDIGKVFEYDGIRVSDTWYANHRVRGIEFLAGYKDHIIELYDERFYRQLQAIIAGHHGEYGDRPTTLATGIIHYIDTLESQVTGLIESFEALPKGENKIYNQDWGYLEGF